MRDRPSVAVGDRFVLTEQGKQALDNPERCQCTPVLTPTGVECRQCGTLYGTARQISVAKVRPGGFD